ncbi:hypothetical protein QY890_00930, partial [Latilactobacillus sakei]
WCDPWDNGRGKSNTLKMMLEAMVGSGNMVRGIDIAGDFKRLVKEKNGAYISLDGSDGMINPLEVLGTIIKKQNNAFVVDQAQSFMQHLSKVSDQFRFLNPDFDNAKIQELRLYRGISIFKLDLFLKILIEIQTSKLPT